MLKKFQRIHCKKGFTLTELIIVIAILAVMMAAAAAFSYPVQRMIRSTAATSDAINANETIAEYIRGRLSYADTLYLYYGVDADSPTADMNNSVTSLTGAGGRLSQSYGGKAGALIFRYTENTSEPEKSGYVLYDFPLASGAVYTTACLNGTGATADLADSGAVFNDDFYGDIQRIIYLPKAKPLRNSTRGEVFMNFEILSYQGDPDYIQYQSDGVTVNNSASTYISPNALNSIYMEVDLGFYTAASSGQTPGKTRSDWQKYLLRANTIQKLGVTKRGDANTSSFVLQNFTSSRLGDPKYFTMNLHEVGDDGTFNPPAYTSTGNDVVIFYHIPKYY